MHTDGDLVGMLNSKDTAINLVACLSGQCNLADACPGVRQACPGVRQKYAVSSLFGRRPPATTKAVQRAPDNGAEWGQVFFCETGEAMTSKIYETATATFCCNEIDWMTWLGRCSLGSFHLHLSPTGLTGRRGTGLAPYGSEDHVAWKGVGQC